MKLLFAASGIESLITLLIFVGISVLSTWLKRRQKPDDTSTPPLPSQPQRTPKSANWEEELRRLIEGEEAPAAPPPVVVQETPRPAPMPRALQPPPLPRPAPVVIAPEENEEDKGLTVQLPTLTQSAQAYLRGSTLDDKVEEQMRQRGAMAESSAAYQRASQLEAKVAAHFRQVTEQVAHFTAAPHAKAVAPHIVSARALIHSRPSLQSAIVASLILGPPKALEQ